jgi:hypothetical protein
MKKLIGILLLISLANSDACAQHKLGYGFNIGGGLGIQSINNSAVILNNSIRTLNANLVVAIPVYKEFFLRTGMGLQNKGTVIDEDALATTNRITYIELPVMISRKLEIPTLGKLVFGLGGYVAKGIAGTIDYETPNSNTSNKIAFGDDYDFQQYDAGISALAGLELNNRLTFNLGYDFGLYNIASQTLKDTGTLSIFNREFTITMGVKF